MKIFVYVLIIDNEETVINSNNKDKQFLYKIDKILEDNYQDSNFNVKQFVELSKERRTVFFRKVKHITGFSPNELLKMKRLNKSVTLLAQYELNISEIAYKVGFEDPYYFSKCFKSHFNSSPTEYRKKREQLSF